MSNHDLLIRCAQLAKENNLKIAIDLASYNVVEANLDFLKPYMMQFVDIVFANEEEAKAFTSKEPIDAVKELSTICELAIVKVGSQGSYIKKEENFIHVPANEVKSIDTTGAGDLYAAGFMYGLLGGYDLEKCARLGSLLASYVIQIIGARIPYEQWNKIGKEVKEILEK